MKNRKRVLVTGAGGYVGTTLVGLLLEQDYKVHAVDNFFKGDADGLLGYCTNKNFTFEKGDEMGRFKLGSTVVSAFAPNMIEFAPEAGPETVTRLGEHYATLTNATNANHNE